MEDQQIQDRQKVIYILRKLADEVTMTDMYNALELMNIPKKEWKELMREALLNRKILI